MNALEDTDAEIYAHMSNHRAGAFFYLPKPETRSLIELVRTSGMAHPGVRRLQTGAEIAGGGWGPLVGSWRGGGSTPGTWRWSSTSRTTRMRSCMRAATTSGRETHPVEEDPGMPLAYAFRDTCQRLEPEVGILTFNPLVLDTELQARDVYPLIERIDVDGLSTSGGLLYLNEDRKDLLLGLDALYGQDQLPIERGILLFSGRGVNRWR